MNRLPNVLKSRHGVYYLRTYRNGSEVRTSLRTKDWATAKLLALNFHLGRAMPLRKLDVEFPSGFKISNVHTADDYERLKELLANGDLRSLHQKPKPPNALPLVRVEPEREQHLGR